MVSFCSYFVIRVKFMSFCSSYVYMGQMCRMHVHMSTWDRCVGHVPIWTHVRNGYLWLLNLLPFLSKFCFVSIPVAEFLLCGKWMLDLICLHFYFFFLLFCPQFVFTLRIKAQIWWVLVLTLKKSSFFFSVHLSMFADPQ